MKKEAQNNANKPHIGIYGTCNSGKSTLFNLLSSVDAAIVSPQAGTTTDPVKRSIEIEGFAPVVLIDTAGVDDISILGSQRTSKTFETLEWVDLAIVVLRQTDDCCKIKQLVGHLKATKTPYITILNGTKPVEFHASCHCEVDAVLDISKQENRTLLVDLIKKSIPESSYTQSPLLVGRNLEGKGVVMVCPIDSAAPAGRIILPQVQLLRELLDMHAVAIVIQPQELADALATRAVELIVTDSQVVGEVKAIVKSHAESKGVSPIEITTFSILFAASKGDIERFIEGLNHIATLKEGDKILILESCIHHTSCEDIGRVKIPVMLQKHLNINLNFEFVSGLAPLPEDVDDFVLAIQCGGCMVTRRQLLNRLRRINIPVTNYGLLLNTLM